MARTKQFDPEAAVDAAMLLFWEKGYEATSLTDLLSRLGIGRASFYDTFGSKQELYLRAIDRYMSGAAGVTPIEILSRSGSPLDAVRSLIEDYARPNPVEQPRGCLVVNACVECPDDNAVLRRRLDTYRAGLESALATTLYRARTEGELPASADPLSLARFLTVVLNGLQVLARSAEPDTERLTAAVEVAVSALR